MQDTIPDAADGGIGSEIASVPGYFWAVAVVGLLWNCIGAYFYLASKFETEATLAGMPPAMQDYVLHMPLWGHVGWSLGIWGSFVGSVLMLVRRRYAVAAFVISLLGAVASYTAQGIAGVLTPAEPLLILTVIALLLWICSRAQARGLLR